MGKRAHDGHVGSYTLVDSRNPQPGEQHVAASALGKPVIKQCLRAAFPSKPKREPREVRANRRARLRTKRHLHATLAGLSIDTTQKPPKAFQPLGRMWIPPGQEGTGPARLRSVLVKASSSEKRIERVLPLSVSTVCLRQVLRERVSRRSQRV